MPAYQTDIQVMNRALQILRRPSISRRTMQSAEAIEAAAAYDQRREAELSTNLWRFATRRVVLRAVTSGTTLLYEPAAYAAGTTYSAGAIVTYDSQWWQSKVGSNLGNTPGQGSYWRRYVGVDTVETFDEDVGYYAGEIVTSGGAYYLSLSSDNEGNTPPNATYWLALGGSSSTLRLLYPLGTGPAADTTTGNLYRLPRGFLKQAPSNPKGAWNVWMGMPRGNGREDYVFEDNYIISAASSTLFLRYVADMIDVPDFHPLFNEMLAASIAVAIGPSVAVPELLTTVLREARTVYRQTRMDARRHNAIEVGPIDPDLDDYISCRM